MYTPKKSIKHHLKRFVLNMAHKKYITEEEKPSTTSTSTSPHSSQPTSPQQSFTDLLNQEQQEKFDTINKKTTIKEPWLEEKPKPTHDAKLESPQQIRESEKEVSNETFPPREIFLTRSSESLQVDDTHSIHDDTQNVHEEEHHNDALMQSRPDIVIGDPVPMSTTLSNASSSSTSTHHIPISPPKTSLARHYWRGLLNLYSKYFANSHLAVYVHMVLIAICVLLHFGFVSLNLIHVIALPWESTMPLLIFNLCHGMLLLLLFIAGIFALTFYWRTTQSFKTRLPIVVYTITLIFMHVVYLVGILFMRDLGSRALTQPNGAVLDSHLSYFLRKNYLWFIAIVGILVHTMINGLLIICAVGHNINLYVRYKNPDKRPTVVRRVLPIVAPDAI